MMYGDFTKVIEYLLKNNYLTVYVICVFCWSLSKYYNMVLILWGFNKLLFWRKQTGEKLVDI